MNGIFMSIKIEFETFIKGELVDLVVLTEEVIDKTNWYKWFNDEESTKNMQKHYFPNSKNQQKEYFRNEIEGNNNKLQLGIFYKADKIMIGTISLNSIDYLNRCCEISMIIGEKRARSTLYFIESVKLICRHAFDSLNMNRIYGGTIAKEIDQLFCRALGFKHEGVLRQEVFKNGKHQDVYRYALLKQDYTVHNE
jgi:[ribosomal protein S5]-alanine N-acetyltransferase